MKLASWIVVLAAAGFAMSWLGAGIARWDRDALILVYALVLSVLGFGYFRFTGVDFRKSLARRWQSGGWWVWQ